MDFAAAISVESPAYGGPAGNPLRVTGFGAVFEATFQYALADSDGRVIAEGGAMTDNGTGWGGLDFTIPYVVDQRQVGALIVWANSAKDGSQIDVPEYPVVSPPEQHPTPLCRTGAWFGQQADPTSPSLR